MKAFYVHQFSNVFLSSDYVFDNLKFHGNAQSITRNRWIHHISFLWNYDTRNWNTWNIFCEPQNTDWCVLSVLPKFYSNVFSFIILEKNFFVKFEWCMDKILS
jgi:hypothetical protein